MYWYKKSNIIKSSAALALASAALFHSCQPQESTATTSIQHHADLPGFFKNEIKRLNQKRPMVQKTVVKDSLSESKTIAISDWERELSSFTNIDLNKPAYQNVFEKDSAEHQVTYTSTNPKIDIQEVVIQYRSDETPLSFLIKRRIENLLYNTYEILSYEASKGYSIEKKQHILILGDKKYLIQGTFKN